MRFGITARLGVTFLLMLVMMTALTWVGVSQVNHLNRNLTEINEVNSIKQRYAINFRGSVHDRAIAIRDVVITNADGRRQAMAKIEKLAADYAKNEVDLTDKVAEVGASDAERKIIEEINAIQAKTNPLVGEVIAAQQAGDVATAHATLAELSPLFDAWLASINAYIDYQEDHNQKMGAEVATVANNFTVTALIALGVAALFALGAAWLSHRVIAAPIVSLAKSMRRMAEGDFKETALIKSSAVEIMDMAEAVEVFRQNGIKVAEMTALEAERMTAALDAKGQIDAVSKSQAVVEFEVDGVIKAANENFCSLMGYRADELVGAHHSMLTSPELAGSAEYRAFWEALRSGVSHISEFQRFGKGGKEIWVQASYSPIVGADGKVFKVVKFAIDITGRKAAVNELRDALSKLSEGDLSTHIETPFTSEFEDVRKAFNTSVEQFAGIVGNLRTTSATLRTATGEILAGTNDLSTRTTHQAATIEQTSAAMDLLATTVAENARQAQEANHKMQSAATVAEEGEQMMAEATSAIQRITSSSARVADIIDVIDNIAFQTNLLALNASVEAARAGEVGKSFGVVAQEVRSLSQSVAKSSEEIKQLVRVSNEEVHSGSRLVSEASNKLHAILLAMRDNAAAMSEIAVKSQEQASSIHEVNIAVRDMDETTQHNAALVEQTSAAIEQTEAQAGELDRIVSVFRTGAGNVEAIRRPKPVAAPRPTPAVSPRRFVTHGSAAVDTDWEEF